MHSGAFGLNLTAIVIALVALSQDARSAGLIPRALALIAPAGAACLFVAAVSTVAIAEGAQWIYLGYLGFIVWGVFVAVTGAALPLGRSAMHSAATGEVHSTATCKAPE